MLEQAAILEIGGDMPRARQEWQPIRVVTPAAAARRPIMR
jgi:hypothetical protein